MKRTILIFLGPPGSGKGTQSDLLAEKIGLPVISTGELLRNEQTKGTPIGHRVGYLLNKGSMVPNDIVFQLLKKRSKRKDAHQGFLIDGFPRQKNQIPDLEKLLKPHDLVLAISIDISDQEAKQRISGRRVCDCGASYHLKYNPPKKKGVCDLCGRKLKIRPDDKPAVVARRLQDYHHRSQDILKYFADKKQLIKIDGEQDIKQVQNDILKQIKKYDKINQK